MRRTASLLALLAVLPVACTRDAAGPDVPPTAPTGPSAPSGTVAPPTPGPDGVALEDVRVLDGDSLQATLGGRSVEIRLLGINTPERDECRADDSRAALAALVDAGEVEYDDRGEDQYGRRLGYVTAGGVFVNAALVATGDALAIRGEHPYEAGFLAAQEDAYRAGLGLWAPDACGPPTGADVRIEEVDGDPPGRDDHPVDGESVLIGNHGTARVDLSGWVLRDESSVHRYEFPSGTVLDPGATLRVFSVCGAADHCFGEWDTVWSNGGDTALLLDPAGNVVDRAPFDG